MPVDPHCFQPVGNCCRRPMYGLCLALWAVCLSPLLFAEEGAKAFIDPDKAGVDFTIQGEYQGELNTPNGKQIYGAQIIAMGEGHFSLVGYIGGLPGDGWKPGTELRRADGYLSGELARFATDEFTAVAAKDKLTVSANGSTLGVMEKRSRKSPTLGAEPPAGAIVLFNGESAGMFANGKLNDEKLLIPEATSLEKFGDHELHLEFRTPFMPDSRGQGRGNSGLYLQHRYECQVLDSFGLEGLDNECGGFYQLARPKVNMCFPPLAWQTYDIDFTAAKYDASGKKVKNAEVTVKHNGVVIHEKQELERATAGGTDEGPAPGPIFLQDHGNPVAFRNIWVVKKGAK